MGRVPVVSDLGLGKHEVVLAVVGSWSLSRSRPVVTVMYEWVWCA